MPDFSDFINEKDWKNIYFFCRSNKCFDVLHQIPIRYADFSGLKWDKMCKRSSFFYTSAMIWTWSSPTQSSDFCVLRSQQFFQFNIDHSVYFNILWKNGVYWGFIRIVYYVVFVQCFTYDKSPLSGEFECNRHVFCAICRSTLFAFCKTGCSSGLHRLLRTFGSVKPSSAAGQMGFGCRHFSWFSTTGVL